jgi:hypothetical protein
MNYFECKKLFPNGFKDKICNCSEDCLLEIETVKKIEEIEKDIQEVEILVHLTNEIEK